MSEILQNNLNNLIIFITATLEEGKGFVINNSPLYIQEIVLYNRIRWIIIDLLLLGIIITTCLLYKKFKKQESGRSFSDWNSEGRMFVVLFGFIVSTLAGIFLIAAIPEVIKWFAAPNIALLKYVLTLIK